MPEFSEIVKYNPNATPTAYIAVALQRRTHVVNGMSRAEARESIWRSVRNVDREIRAALEFHGKEARLFLLPEFSFTGFALFESIRGFADLAALDPDGPEYQHLQETAQRHRIFLGGHAYETDPHFPGLFFAATWLINPSGDLVLRYRRLHSTRTPSPYDVWDEYLEHYGIDKVFPVADTELGKIASIPCGEILFPELSRALALRGAEVLLHPTSDTSGIEPDPFHIAVRARAQENLMYVVSSNAAASVGLTGNENATNGLSEIVDYEGRLLRRASTGESQQAAAEIDIAALRRARSRPTPINLLVLTTTRLWAEEYGRYDGVTGMPNTLRAEVREKAIDNPNFHKDKEQRTIEQFRRAGIIA